MDQNDNKHLKIICNIEDVLHPTFISEDKIAYISTKNKNLTIFDLQTNKLEQTFDISEKPHDLKFIGSNKLATFYTGKFEIFNLEKKEKHTVPLPFENQTLKVVDALSYLQHKNIVDFILEDGQRGLYDMEKKITGKGKENSETESSPVMHKVCKLYLLVSPYNRETIIGKTFGSNSIKDNLKHLFKINATGELFTIPENNGQTISVRQENNHEVFSISNDSNPVSTVEWSDTDSAYLITSFYDQKEGKFIILCCDIYSKNIYEEMIQLTYKKKNDTESGIIVKLSPNHSKLLMLNDKLLAVQYFNQHFSLKRKREELKN